MAAVTICSDFGAQKIKVWHCFPIYFPWSDGTGCQDLRFRMLSFKPTFSLSSFTFIKRLFSSSSLSAIRVVSSAYLRLLIFLPAILIPACASSSPAFLVMYSGWLHPYPEMGNPQTGGKQNDRGSSQGARVTSASPVWGLLYQEDKLLEHLTLKASGAYFLQSKRAVGDRLHS